MNGRCETDPFDQAIDVCPSCFGEFCETCLIKAKRRKHRLCRECTIVVSGLRVGAKPAVRGDKRTVDERRKVLKAAPIEQQFEYFDMKPADEASVASRADTSPRPGNDTLPAGAPPADGSAAAVPPVLGQSSVPEYTTSRDEASRPESVAAVEDPASPTRSKTSAIDQLGFIREAGAAPAQAGQAGREGERSTHNPSTPHPVTAPEAGAEHPSADDRDVFRPPRPFIASRAGPPQSPPAAAKPAPVTEAAGAGEAEAAPPIAAFAALTRAAQSTPPPTASPIPEPSTAEPPFWQPPTPQPPTRQPPTAQPPTRRPPTAQPPTAQPPTAQPPTAAPSPVAEAGPSVGSIRPTPPADPAPLPRRRQTGPPATADSADPPAWTTRPVAERPQ